MGESNLVSSNNLGGSSKLFWEKSIGSGIVARAVQGLGFPGSSSHLNGTETEV